MGSAADHEGHDVIEMPIHHEGEVRLYCKTCQITSPGKVRDLTPDEMNRLHPMVQSLSRFD